MATAFADIAFTDAVQAVQHKAGSDRAYAKFLEGAVDQGDRIGPAEHQFISLRDGFYQASVSQTGWPYVQFRGGPRGFLQVLDEKTIGYADLRGNRQYVSVGNFAGNDRISMILMDYPNQRRLKVMGRVRIVEPAEDADLIARLTPPGQKMQPERAVLIDVAAVEWNCPRNIPVRLTLEELDPFLQPMRDRIAELEAENADLRAAISATNGTGALS